ncbi:DinB family protein [Paenibacillus sp. R14(2021)]|uniref:DinB family protein n=1 Tax=Paenibacillus sp. R14(2021) TaxID=2859228 RepID=UPI001C611464|nr:DinB family protein [Paenibacillus sp. R14(2021)]
METVRKLLDHMYRSDEGMLEALRAGGGTNAEAIRLYAHVLRGEQVWMVRLKGQSIEQLEIWPEDNLDDCAKAAKANRAAYTAYFDALSPERLDEMVIYGYPGRPYQASIRDILTHVAMHGQYHRGQINAKIRAVGGEPVSVDYIKLFRSVL